MSDLIDRDALKKAIGKVYACDWDDIEKNFHFAEAVNSLPSVEPEPKWISVTEALPKDGERVLTTIDVGSRGKKVRSGTYFKSLFQCDNGDVWTVTDKEVIAWMPLPEPYRGE